MKMILIRPGLWVSTQYITAIRFDDQHQANGELMSSVIWACGDGFRTELVSKHNAQAIIAAINTAEAGS